MNQYLQNKLSETLLRNGLDKVEFKNWGKELDRSQINFLGVRGSVRLMNHNVLTLKEVEAIKASVIKFNFGY